MTAPKFPKSPKRAKRPRKERVPEQLRWDACKKNGWKCPICEKSVLYSDSKIEYHHAGMHDTAGNRENYPNIINSAVNGWMLHAECHAKNPGYGHWSEQKAKAMEEFYRQFWLLVDGFELTPAELRGVELDFRRMYEEAAK